MTDFLNSSVVRDMCDTIDNMYRLGWDERNGGNISWLLEEDEILPYIDPSKTIRVLPLLFDASKLAGKLFLVTGTGCYFKNVSSDPEEALGLIRISDNGTGAELLWGWMNGGRYTSELPAHLMSHIARLEADPENRIILHSHPTNTLAMSFIHELDAGKFTRSLWEMITECILVFPDGIGVLPWMVCGNDEIGIATAEKMRDYRLVVWALHGVYAAGASLDEAFGLVETVEKAAQLYMMTAGLPRVNHVTDQQLAELAQAFGKEYRRDFLAL